MIVEFRLNSGPSDEENQEEIGDKGCEGCGPAVGDREVREADLHPSYTHSQEQEEVRPQDGQAPGAADLGSLTFRCGRSWGIDFQMRQMSVANILESVLIATLRLLCFDGLGSGGV